MAPSRTAFPRQRRQTLLLMRVVRGQVPVQLAVDVDLTAVTADRSLTPPSEHPASITSYLVLCAARALGGFPQARTLSTGRLRPRRYGPGPTTVKVVLDATHAGERFVAAHLVTDADRRPLADLDTDLRAAAAAGRDGRTAPADLRALWRLPFPLAALAFALATRPSRRLDRLGALTVSNLGARGVHQVAPLGGSPLSLGIGAVRQAVVPGDQGPQVRPVLTLTLVFDHRSLDGALAADLLADLVHRVENWPARRPGPPAGVGAGPPDPHPPLPDPAGLAPAGR